MKLFLFVHMQPAKILCKAKAGFDIREKFHAPQQEVEQLIKKAIEFHIEGLKDDGEEIPEPHSTPIRVMVA